MGFVEVPPTDPTLRYSGYVQLQLDAESVRFSRQYGSSPLDGFGPAAQQNGGARISWRTAAERVSVYVTYARSCAEDCSLNLDGRTCYRQGACADCHGRCLNECRLSLLLDGRETEVPAFGRDDGHYSAGRHRFELPTSVTDGKPHEYTIVLPWGASVEFLGLTLWQQGPQAPVLSPPLFQSSVAYVAYGDSITHGFCGSGHSYPEQVAQLNGWVAVNMGIQGMPAGSASRWGHGQAIAERNPDVVTILIGINDCFAGDGLPGPGVGEAVGRIVDGLRHAAPAVPVAVVTPIVTAGGFASWRTFTETLREQIRAAVGSRIDRGDAALRIVEGLPLVPEAYMFEGLHPNAKGYQAMARNLNAELGFSQVKFAVSSCAPLELELEGLTPSGKFAIYIRTTRERDADRLAVTVDDCDGFAVMLHPERTDRGIADPKGRATHSFPAGFSCDHSSWQVLDLGSCLGSRFGHSEGTDRTRGTLAELMSSSSPLAQPLRPSPLPLLPPPPPPRSPPSPSMPSPLSRPPSPAPSVPHLPPKLATCSSPKPAPLPPPPLLPPIQRPPPPPSTWRTPTWATGPPAAHPAPAWASSPIRSSGSLVRAHPTVPLLPVVSGGVLGLAVVGCAFLLHQVCLRRLIHKTSHRGRRRAPPKVMLPAALDLTQSTSCKLPHPGRARRVWRLALCVHRLEAELGLAIEDDLDIEVDRLDSMRDLQHSVRSALLRQYGEAMIRDGFRILYDTGNELLIATTQVPLDVVLRRPPLHVIFNDGRPGCMDQLRMAMGDGSAPQRRSKRKVARERRQALGERLPILGDDIFSL